MTRRILAWPFGMIGLALAVFACVFLTFADHIQGTRS